MLSQIDKIFKKNSAQISKREERKEETGKSRTQSVLEEDKEEGNNDGKMSRSKKRRQKRKNKHKERQEAQNATQPPPVNPAVAQNPPQGLGKALGLSSSGKAKVSGQQAKIQDYASSGSKGDKHGQKKLNKREQKSVKKEDNILVSNEWQNTLKKLLCDYKETVQPEIEKPGLLKAVVQTEQKDELASSSSKSKRKNSGQKFKTPPPRKQSNDSNSISSISEQDEESAKEFDELWTGIKIKNNYSDSKAPAKH
uniref:Uncharacterized protein n=1 Tax=Euplotes harpa TaxID=151035 RepID=A0A7S3NBC0_9SPIT|mmetsp:Transcript_32624/g.37206  ORF Transcript_32624/g.37206 Transcript_32624/m.37206 type:complete len:253 (+) Transcript_32624:760-1518(+)